MSAGHDVVDPRSLHLAGDSGVHRLDATAKLVGLVGFVVLVALTPREAVWVFAADAAAVGLVVLFAGLPPKVVLARLGAIVPFVAFAFFLPVIGTGRRVDVVGVSLSADGLWACWGIIARAMLGAAAAVTVTATTSLADLLRALRRLHVPAVVVSIISVMLRYLGLVTDHLGRMRRAMTARGHDPRWIWQVRPVASSIGTLFVRTYERGERVHLAMVARGFDGTLPTVDPPVSATRVASAWAAIPVLVAASSLAVWTMVT
ncbi:MAG TPA: cobalt ECF transporter T component CbiQ [Acidimicrobiales bacterium]|nr:cobalt ECF transporter T component CbiQ [Acidimicrobiales bacterium]